MIGLLLALAGLGLGLAVLAVGWAVVRRGFGARRLVVDDSDIYRAANELIEQHGGAAASHAAKRADELMGTGDMDGQAVWVRVMGAIDELLRCRPEPGKPKH